MSELQGYGQNISSVSGVISCMVVCDLGLWQGFMQVDGLKSRGLVASGATFPDGEHSGRVRVTSSDIHLHVNVHSMLACVQCCFHVCAHDIDVHVRNIP